MAKDRDRLLGTFKGNVLPYGSRKVSSGSEVTGRHEEVYAEPSVQNRHEGLSSWQLFLAYTLLVQFGLVSYVARSGTDRYSLWQTH
jgi:hypothetical protein